MLYMSSLNKRILTEFLSASVPMLNFCRKNRSTQHIKTLIVKIFVNIFVLLYNVLTCKEVMIVLWSIGIFLECSFLFTRVKHNSELSTYLRMGDCYGER